MFLILAYFLVSKWLFLKVILRWYPCDYLLVLIVFQVNYDELARCTDDFNGAMLKAVCVEAGMIALRREATELIHEDYMDGLLEVQAKKKSNLVYYA